MTVDAKWIREVPRERWPSFHDIGPFYVSTARKKENFFDALSFQAQPSDLFISTYPKNGTTWTQQIIYLIQHDAKSPKSREEFYANSVYLEMAGKKAAEAIVKPGCVKVHVPQYLTPWNDQAKYIIVVRNPKDVAVSYYYHTKGKTAFQFANGSFDDFFDLFMAGFVEYGDYFHFVNSWLDKSHLPNVFIITYEYMKSNIKEAIAKIAHFMDSDLYGKRVDTEPDFVEEIINKSTFDFMKATYNEGFSAVRSNEGFNFFRKGVVNDWKSMMSDEQNKRITQRFVEEGAKNPKLMSLWHDYSWLHDQVTGH